MILGGVVKSYTYDGDSRRVDQFGERHGREIGDIDQHIQQGYHGQRNVDGERQIPATQKLR